ncbi:PD-(D/E)XK nuclease family protein [Nocardioides zhouii]|uniref:PD-(D/E)XK nuclease family protein n=1 Tax=Nocardioides zhouii TaxID=1168729 RepID=A0A4Q2SN94_9ACTN|nr:PD-(D/E)XK nuclease family protein [Nocardioides zhouii]
MTSVAGPCDSPRGLRIPTSVSGVITGQTALEQLCAVVGDLKRDDPLAPVTILAPSNIAAITARRALASRGGVAAIQVTTVNRLAEQLGAPSLAPRRPATRAVTASAWRAALAAAPGAFAEVADHPATVAALTRAHPQLRDLDDQTLDVIASEPAPAGDLVRLHREVSAALEGSWFDTADLLESATANVAAIEGAVVLYLPGRLDNCQRRFVDAIGGLILVAPTENLPIATRVIHASDSDDEVRCVVRDVVIRLGQQESVAVLYADRTPYARLLAEQFHDVGVTINGPGSRPVSERGTARSFLDLLALVENDVPRSDLFRALGAIGARNFAGEFIPVARWERLSRAAGVVRGDHWDGRLSSWISSEARSGDRPAAQALQAFTLRLRNELSRSFDDWRAISDWGTELFETLIADETRQSKLPPEEQHAARTILLALRGVTVLDDTATPPTIDTLLSVLQVDLESALPRVGRFGDGVYVGPLATAPGLAVDTMYVVGLSEDLYPGSPSDSALLPDRIRRKLNGELPTLADKVELQRQHLVAAFAAAPTVVASFPRGDLRQTRERLPSRWLLPTLRALSGEPGLAATQWAEAPFHYGVEAAGSFAGELETTEHQATEQEWRVRAARADVLDDSITDHARSVVAARESPQFTRFDGNLAGAPGLPDYRASDHVISPTALERFAGCPHAFFVERLLSVKPIENPEDIVSIPANELGTFIHECMDDLAKKFADELPGPGQPWTGIHRDALLELAEKKALQYEHRGVTGHQRLWAIEKAKILSTLSSMLDVDNDWRAQVGAEVKAAELAFGMDGSPPIEISVPGGRVLMRGSADKVDLTSDRVYVTDIKTGSTRRFKDIKQHNPVPFGAKLQLPAYAIAAQRALGTDLPVTASYWFVHKEDRRIDLVVDDQVRQTYAGVIDVLTEAIAAGHFPNIPPAGDDFAFVQCAFCNPDGLGYGALRRAWNAKAAQPELSRLTALLLNNEVKHD